MSNQKGRKRRRIALASTDVLNVFAKHQITGFEHFAVIVTILNASAASAGIPPSDLHAMLVVFAAHHHPELKSTLDRDWDDIYNAMALVSSKEDSQ